MQCVILAGGMGTRMSGYTKNKIPKCMIKINKKPFIDYQLQYLAANNVKNVLLSVSYLKEQIIDYIEDGSKWGITVEYTDDGDIPLGTGGALRKAYGDFKLHKSFKVIYGDSFLPIDFESMDYFYLKQKYHALMAVYKNENAFDKSNAKLQGLLVEYNKNNPQPDYNYIDYGISYLTSDIIERHIPEKTKYDLSDLLYKLSKQNELAGYEVYQRFYEIGSLTGLNDFDFWLGNNYELFNNS